MAKTTLPVNYKDDVLTSSMNGKRRYNLVQNTDGTYCLEDVTTYTQVGSDFGAADINKTNTAVNASADASKIIDNVNDIKANTQAGYITGAKVAKELISDLGGYQFRLNNGVPEYKAGADAAWVPFRQVPKLIASYNGNAEYGTITKTYTAVTDSVIIAIAMGVTGNDYVSAAYSPSTSAKITGKGSVSIAFNQKIYGNNTNLSRPGMGILSTYICTLKNGDELTVSIIPFESQFRSGYNIVFLQS